MAKRRRKNAGKVISLAAFRKTGKVEEEGPDDDDDDPEGDAEKVREYRERRERGELWWQGGRPGGPAPEDRTPEAIRARAQIIVKQRKLRRQSRRLQEVTQGRWSPSTVKRNMETVRQYDDEMLAAMAFQSTEEEWMKKPSFYRAVMDAAAERWGMFKPNPPKRNKRKSKKKKPDAKAILRRAMRGT